MIINDLSKYNCQMRFHKETITQKLPYFVEVSRCMYLDRRSIEQTPHPVLIKIQNKFTEFCKVHICFYLKCKKTLEMNVLVFCLDQGCTGRVGKSWRLPSAFWAARTHTWRPEARGRNILLICTCEEKLNCDSSLLTTSRLSARHC
jgi:hypothetical protein